MESPQLEWQHHGNTDESVEVWDCVSVDDDGSLIAFHGCIEVENSGQVEAFFANFETRDWESIETEDDVKHACNALVKHIYQQPQLAIIGARL